MGMKNQTPFRNEFDDGRNSVAFLEVGAISVLRRKSDKAVLIMSPKDALNMFWNNLHKN